VSLSPTTTNPRPRQCPYFNQVGPAVAQMTPILENAVSNAPGIALALAEQILEAAERSRQSSRGCFPRIGGAGGAICGPNRAGAGAGAERYVRVHTASCGESQDCCSLVRRPCNATSFSSATTVSTSAVSEEPVLRARVGQLAREEGLEEARVECILLTGTHATPLAPDVRWPVGPAFTPADAVAVALKAAALLRPPEPCQDCHQLAQIPSSEF